MRNNSLIYTDAQLVEKCTKGDMYAQKQLYISYAPKLYVICCLYSSCKEDAKDVLQESFIKIFNNIKSYKNSGSLEGWLKRIVVNTALSKYKQTKKSVVSYSSEIENIGTSAYDELTEEEFDHCDEQFLLEVIANLPDEYRIVFNLHCIENHSHKEIAGLLTITEETSRIRLLRARKKIIKHLASLKNKKTV
jgi:RNA polymerase sigma-70 factor, ECF subfamily